VLLARVGAPLGAKRANAFGAPQNNVLCILRRAATRALAESSSCRGADLISDTSPTFHKARFAAHSGKYTTHLPNYIEIFHCICAWCFLAVRVCVSLLVVYNELPHIGEMNSRQENASESVCVSVLNYLVFCLFGMNKFNFSRRDHLSTPELRVGRK